MEFLDRIEERQRLRRLLDASNGALACLYGRRRCGKTRLLRECVKNRRSVFYHLADKSERTAQMSRFIQEVSVQIPAFRAATPGDWGVILDLWVQLAPRGSILVLDEFPYLVQRDEALPSILQRICDVLPETGHKVVICGSSQRMMQGFVLKQSEPLYGRAKEIMPITPLPFNWMKAAFPSWRRIDRLKAWGVWGGIPRYWELQSEEQDLWGCVHRNACSPLGILRHEPQFLLLDDLGDTAQASAVLSFVGNGANRMSEIAARMGRPATDLSRPLQRLDELGLVARETPFGADSHGKKSLYRIADHFLNFWYTFVQPNLSRDDFLESANERKIFESQYEVYLGGVWERLVRETLRMKPLPGTDMRWQNMARWWGAGLDHHPMELDIVAESPDGDTLLVGEAKLSVREDEAPHLLSILESRAGNLPFSAKYKRIVTRLFVADNPPPDAVSLAWCEESP